MATQIFLGEPPANIKRWIEEHAAPATHADTWYKYAGDTEWRTVSISGSIDGDVSEETPTIQIPNVLDIVALEIGTTVTIIGDCAFASCSGLTSITIPNSITSIEYGAFIGCNGLTIITIPSSVTSIGEMAFYQCSGLTSITFLGKTLEQVHAMTNYPWDISDTSIIHVA